MKAMPNSEKLTQTNDNTGELEEIPSNMINVKLPSKIILGISSRLHLDLRDEQKLFKEEGLQASLDNMSMAKDVPPNSKSAFPFVEAISNVNLKLLELDPQEKCLFDIVLMSSNWTQFGVDLYLSADIDNVKKALQQGVAAATLYSPSGSELCDTKQLRIAFDGDAVLFLDESKKFAKQRKPLKEFVKILGGVQKKFHCKGMIENCPIRTYVVIGGSATSSGLRALKTFREWGLNIDEALFLAGAPKEPILEKIKPHWLFGNHHLLIVSSNWEIRCWSLLAGVHKFLLPFHHAMWRSTPTNFLFLMSFAVSSIHFFFGLPIFLP